MHAELSNPFPNVRNELIARALSVERLLISTWRECFKPSDAVALVAVGEFARAARVLVEDVVDVLEGLFKHGSCPCFWLF